MFNNECFCMHLSLRNTNQNIYTLAFWFLSSLSLSLSNKVKYLNTEWLLVIIHTIYRMFNCVNSNRNHSKCALLWLCDHLFDSSKMKFTYRGLKCWINDYLERSTLCQKKIIRKVILNIFSIPFYQWIAIVWCIFIKKRYTFLSKIHSKNFPVGKWSK